MVLKKSSSSNQSPTSILNPTWFRQRLLDWYETHGRKDLPWKSPITPYGVWVSEIMLQQTQVSTVIGYFEKFMQRFPNIEKLASARQDSVLKYWAGLGYYARARNLHKTAKIIVKDHAGSFPKDIDALLALPGIGRSTAGAILAQAFDLSAPILDGNVKRVLARLLCLTKPKEDKTQINELWDWSEKLTPQKRVGEYTQAIMDIGAMICTRTKPKCEICPFEKKCLAKQQDSISQILKTKKSTRKPIKKTTFVCLLYQDQILLQKRPQKGIWGGLYCLPDFLDKGHAQVDLIDDLELAEASRYHPRQRHSFTHYHLEYDALFVRLAKKPSLSHLGTWFDKQRLQGLGFPVPIQQLLKPFLQPAT